MLLSDAGVVVESGQVDSVLVVEGLDGPVQPDVVLETTKWG